MSDYSAVALGLLSGFAVGGGVAVSLFVSVELSDLLVAGADEPVLEFFFA
ncbi:MAG TPA: hypothetical protein VMU24_00660 [Candidatus Acidoferrales bacterium]|nr:hypothetical protein [Candidatus Acidoferrales bacterium]